MVKCALYNGTNVAATALAHLVEMWLIHRTEDDSEGDEEEQWQHSNSNYHLSIDGKPLLKWLFFYLHSFSISLLEMIPAQGVELTLNREY